MSSYMPAIRCVAQLWQQVVFATFWVVMLCLLAFVLTLGLMVMLFVMIPLEVARAAWRKVFATQAVR